MKRLGYFYLTVMAIVVTFGYLLDDILGIWRQGIVGIPMIAIGVLLRPARVKRESSASVAKMSISATILLACGILLTIALRLLSANLFFFMDAKAAPAYEGVSFVVRLIGSAILPGLCAPVLAFHILPSLIPSTSKWAKLILVGLAFMPFCTVWTYLPASFLLGVIIASCDYVQQGNRTVNAFVAYFVLMFYDTLSVSVGSVDFNLTVRQASVFFLISLAVALFFGYLALRTFRERKFRVGEFLTVLFLSVLLLLVGIAL